ncbi:hypothetical protein L5G32_18820 [Gordonia sp. HY002]|uniref:hypothetical protein n=1 Tax=Gordonia zhenghanii TaxID=2911516 RepID=UPI001EF13D2D|nr:hypothetical protein [Gordonia zhenghanii]MCF8572312.1 hypothetical protein [Gordonia zhenghanii]MCF8606765.1 hypothetical protein [Gordonia zhenghanii]
MHIRLTSADSPADPATHGVLAAVVSAILGIAAHGFGGGFGAHGPATSHVVILLSLAVVVGVVRAGQVKGAQTRGGRRFVGTGWTATAAALVGGQAAAHISLAMLGHGSMAPGASMLAWHVVALPAAVGVLVVAECLAHSYGSQVAVVLGFAEGFATDDIAPTVPAPAVETAYSRALQSVSGVRGPPAMV